MSFNQEVAIVDSNPYSHVNRYEVSDTNNLTYTAEQFVNSLIVRTSIGNSSDTTPAASDIINYLNQHGGGQVGDSFETFFWSTTQEYLSVAEGPGVSIYNGNSTNFYLKNEIHKMTGIVSSSDSVDLFYTKVSYT